MWPESGARGTNTDKCNGVELLAGVEILLFLVETFPEMHAKSLAMSADCGRSSRQARRGVWRTSQHKPSTPGTHNEPPENLCHGRILDCTYCFLKTSTKTCWSPGPRSSSRQLQHLHFTRWNQRTGIRRAMARDYYHFNFLRIHNCNTVVRCRSLIPRAVPPSLKGQWQHAAPATPVLTLSHGGR